MTNNNEKSTVNNSTQEYSQDESIDELDIGNKKIDRKMKKILT